MKGFFIRTLVLVIGISIGAFIASKLEVLMDLGSVENGAIIEEDVLVGKEDNSYVSELILVNEYIDSIGIDLKYATKNNILGEKLYEKNMCYLQKNTAEKLKKANEELMQKGYRLRIWDGYRPLSLQKKIWAKYPDASFVDNPFLGGSDKNKGVGVSVTLTDLNGNEIEFPYGFDEFNKRKSNNYSHDMKMTENIRILTEAMENNGFYSSGEMWYDFVDVDSYHYNILDVSFRDLLKK